MALTKADVLMWREIAPLVPTAPRVLEIGQANWYGDVAPDPLDSHNPKFKGLGPCPYCLSCDCSCDQRLADEFIVARNFYSRMMPGATFTAIDKHGREGAISRDLNKPFVVNEVDGLFDVVINTGTAEHIFNQAVLFESIQNACTSPKIACSACGATQDGVLDGSLPLFCTDKGKHAWTQTIVPGGLMIHAAPLCGWWQHGFYNYHPTFWADLAAANGYEIVYLSQFNLTFGVVRRLQSLGEARPEQGDSMLYVVFRKTKDMPFVVPMQGRYKGAEAIPDPR